MKMKRNKEQEKERDMERIFKTNLKKSTIISQSLRILIKILKITEDFITSRQCSRIILETSNILQNIPKIYDNF